MLFCHWSICKWRPVLSTPEEETCISRSCPRQVSQHISTPFLVVWHISIALISHWQKFYNWEIMWGQYIPKVLYVPATIPPNSIWGHWTWLCIAQVRNTTEWAAGTNWLKVIHTGKTGRWGGREEGRGIREEEGQKERKIVRRRERGRER